MRTLLLAFLFTLPLSTSANQQKFNLNATCFLQSGAQAVCEVCNYQFSRPVACEMQARGLTSRRFWFTGFNRAILYPGQCMNAVVYANNPYVDPLIDARAAVNCRF